MRGLERSQLTVATSALFLHEMSVVHFELLEMEYRDRPAVSTTVALTIFEPLLEILSPMDGRLVWRGGSTSVALKGVGGGDILP
jgi:hypothetical protein